MSRGIEMASVVDINPRTCMGTFVFQGEQVDIQNHMLSYQNYYGLHLQPTLE